jgi:hypothetical protein
MLFTTKVTIVLMLTHSYHFQLECCSQLAFIGFFGVQLWKTCFNCWKEICDYNCCDQL